MQQETVTDGSLAVAGFTVAGFSGNGKPGNGKSITNKY